MWEQLGFGSGIAYEKWPVYDEKAMKRSEIEIAVQVGGKVRGHIMVTPDLTNEQAQRELPEREDVRAFIGDKTLVKLIFVPGRLCNLIVK